MPIQAMILKALQEGGLIGVCFILAGLIGYTLKNLFIAVKDIKTLNDSIQVTHTAILEQYEKLIEKQEMILDAQSVSTQESSRRLSSIEKKIKGEK